jgi:hypothetical protein
LALFVLRDIVFRGADRTVATAAYSTEVLQARNAAILKHMKNFDMDVDVLCKLCEEVFGPSSCTPYLHSLHHMIRRLIVLKGHPTFEMIVERLVSIKKKHCAFTTRSFDAITLIVFPFLSRLFSFCYLL